jgi:hypothetical protein
VINALDHSTVLERFKRELAVWAFIFGVLLYSSSLTPLFPFLLNEILASKCKSVKPRAVM